MWKRCKRAGILVLAIAALMLSLTIDEPFAAVQNSNSSLTIQNSNSKPGVKRKKTSRRRGRRGRRGRA